MHKKKHKKHEQQLPGAGIHPNIIAFVPSRPPMGCEGHPRTNQIAGNIADSSGHPSAPAPSAPSAPGDGGGMVGAGGAPAGGGGVGGGA